MIVAIVVLGGMGSQIGVAVAAVVMIGGTEIMRDLDLLKAMFGSDFDPTQYRMLLFGFAMVLIMIWKPRGLISTREPSVVAQGAQGHSARWCGRATDERRRVAPVLRVEHLTMRFGGLVAVNDLSFTAERGHITALIGPNGAGKTTVFNCITGFYKPTEGRIALQYGDAAVWNELEALTQRGERSRARAQGSLFLLERMPDYLVTQRARVARTFQNIRLFPGMTVLENLLVAQHNAADARVRLERLGALGLPILCATPSAPRSTRRAVARPHRPHRPRRRSRRRAALRRAAPARDRARDVHRPGAALPRRAGRRPQSARKRRARRTTCRRSATRARDLDPADRARHDGGDGDFRPRRRARPRRQDRRRHAAACATTRR